MFAEFIEEKRTGRRRRRTLTCRLPARWKLSGWQWFVQKFFSADEDHCNTTSQLHTSAKNHLLSNSTAVKSIIKNCNLYNAHPYSTISTNSGFIDMGIDKMLVIHYFIAIPVVKECHIR